MILLLRSPTPDTAALRLRSIFATIFLSGALAYRRFQPRNFSNDA